MIFVLRNVLLASCHQQYLPVECLLCLLGGILILPGFSEVSFFTVAGSSLLFLF